ncbi:hypothetical protein AVEN_225308-1 [Araneus ventricosus]|uniref:Uncharacterized protein n=1 Tax=Araneus ventricosus TaxID=182803 RepID=A0A4Y2ANR1_ARAVE|nr:hypothetical protein AVEN_225308-1 [Araneus ventricosus]
MYKSICFERNVRDKGNLRVTAQRRCYIVVSERSREETDEPEAERIGKLNDLFRCQEVKEERENEDSLLKMLRANHFLYRNSQARGMLGVQVRWISSRVTVLWRGNVRAGSFSGPWLLLLLGRREPLFSAKSSNLWLVVRVEVVGRREGDQCFVDGRK